MSDEESKSPVAAEEPMEQNGDDSKAEPAATDKGASGDHMDSGSDSDGGASPPREEQAEEKEAEKTSPKKDAAKSPKKSPKKSSQKTTKDEEDDDEESDDEGDEGDGYGEGKTALLEQPIVLEEGSKRVRKKVERMEIKQVVTPKDKKVEIGEGAGTKLGDVPRVEFHLNKTLSDDLKPLHRVLFSRPGTTNEIKRNIRKFSGFTFEKDSSDYEKKMLILNRCTMSMLKTMSEVLDIERSGTKETVIERLMDFLMSPKSSGKALPKPKKRKSAGGKGEKRRRSKKGEDGEKKPRSPKKKPAKSKEEVEESDDDDDDAASDKEEDSGSEDEKEEESTEEEKPPKKKAKKEAPKKESPKKEAPKKAPKKETAKKEKKETKKAAPKKAAEKKKTPKKQKPKKAPVSDSSDSSESDDEPLVPKKKPPTDEEVREAVKQILEGANLEEVTMKTVCRQVYDKYPDFDLTPRKDFIKATVKQIIR